MIEPHQTLAAALAARGVPLSPLGSAPWIGAIEQRIGRRLPEAYRALTNAYAFPSFEIGSVEWFANRGDGGDDDIARAPFRDRTLSSWLHSHGFFPFARPASGSYDPVCFDLNDQSVDTAIVRIDHEDILLSRRKKRMHRLADSLLDLVTGGAGHG